MTSGRGEGGDFNGGVGAGQYGGGGKQETQDTNKATRGLEAFSRGSLRLFWANRILPDGKAKFVA